jgi:enoyl-CoA hydratase
LRPTRAGTVPAEKETQAMTDEPVVLRETSEGVAHVVVNRPEKLNALNSSVIEALHLELHAAGSDPAVRAVVLTGAGEKAFVAGADIGEMAAMSPAEAQRFSRRGQELGRLIDQLGKPVIAAVPGFALGGGCELAMMCHLRVAGEKAKFGQPEVGLGLIAGFGGTQRLARLVGEGRALELLLTGDPIDAETAHTWGLVNVIAREQTAREAAHALAKKIASKGPQAVELSVRAVRSGLQMPLEQGLEHEASLFGMTFSTEDMREGTQAFLEKRKPDFAGR